MASPPVPESLHTRRRVAQGLYRSTASGKYFAHVRVGGKLFRQSLGTADRQLAERKLSAFRRTRKQVDPRLGKVTLHDLCDRYAETLSHLAPSSCKAKRGILVRIREEWTGGSQRGVTSIRASDCDRWLSRQADRMGRSHANAYIQLLRDLLNFAVRDKIIGENPAAHLKYFKRERPIRATPTWDEFRAIVEEIRNQPFNAHAQESADFVEFLGLSGLGKGEAAALRWSDIDFERGQIITFRLKTATGFAVPIFPQVRPFLERLRASREAGVEERVFGIDDAKKAIAGACKRLGLRHYSHLSFRRMFITRAIERGIDAKVIAQWQGHRDGGKLILDTYSHVNPLHSQRMAKLMTMEEDSEGPRRVAR